MQSPQPLVEILRHGLSGTPVLSLILVLMLVSSSAGAAPSEAAGQGRSQQDVQLEDQYLQIGQSVTLTVPYRIGRVLIADQDICTGQFTLRSSTLEVFTREAGKTEFIIHDVANQVRDTFFVNVLSREAMSLWQETQRLFADIEGLEIVVDGDNVVLRGSLFSQLDLDRVEAEATRSAKLYSEVGLDPMVYVVLHGPSARYRARYLMFEEFDYEDWHHGQRHPHGAISLENFQLLVLRTEGSGGQIIDERASGLVERLNEALLDIAEGRGGSFEVIDDQRMPAVAFRRAGRDPLVIAHVRGGDVIGYRRRSPGYDISNDSNDRITADLVAAWWRAVISDAAAMFIRKQPPSSASRTEEGSVLRLIYERARARSGDTPSTLELVEAIDGADAYERRQLEALGMRVPADFRGG
jgi:hypothetical protein